MFFSKAVSISPTATLTPATAKHIATRVFLRLGTICFPRKACFHLLSNRSMRSIRIKSGYTQKQEGEAKGGPYKYRVFFHCVFLAMIVIELSTPEFYESTLHFGHIAVSRIEFGMITPIKNRRRTLQSL